MTVNLDFKAGDKVICLISNKFSVETITGAATIVVNPDGTINRAVYEIDRPDPIYTHTLVQVDSEFVFRTKEEAMRHVGLDLIGE